MHRRHRHDRHVLLVDPIASYRTILARRLRRGALLFLHGRRVGRVHLRAEHGRRPRRVPAVRKRGSKVQLEPTQGVPRVLLCRHRARHQGTRRGMDAAAVHGADGTVVRARHRQHIRVRARSVEEDGRAGVFHL